MRQLFVISIILIQFLGGFSVEASAAAPTMRGIQKESPLTISSSFQQEHPADITASHHFASSAFKVRYQRTVPAMADWYSDVVTLPVFLDKHFKVYSSPLFLPLVRSLLYPNHYFW
jgi:hypothetical protein